MALALNCGIPSTPQGRELVQHGSALFPIACYEERLTCYSVPWHWHEDFEYILAYEGTVTVGVDKSASVWRKARACSSTPACSMQ